MRVRKPQEGMSSPSGSDGPGQTSILRGAAPRTEDASMRFAWVDEALRAWCDARTRRQARGRRPSATSAALSRDKPWRGPKASPHGARAEAPAEVRARGVEREDQRETVERMKGTAMDAKRASITSRDPRPAGGGAGGSSGGQAHGRARGASRGARPLSLVQVGEAKNPRSGAERSDALRQVGAEQRVRGVETPEAQSTGVGSPGRSPDGQRVLPDGDRTLP